MYQLIKSILHNPDDQTRIHLVYANKTVQDMILFRELNHLKEQFPGRLKVYHTLETPYKGSDVEETGVGRVTKSMLQSHLPSPIQDDNESAVLVCGPDG
jgi:NAD(P)H-flavin reductase